MSMSQEEIEALMNESADLAPAIEPDVASEETVEEEVPAEDNISVDDLKSLVEENDASLDEKSEEETVEDTNIDDILAGIDGITDDKPSEPIAEDTSANIDDMLDGIDGVVAGQPTSADMETVMNERIDQGIYPLPVEKEHKVVNQLNEVAEDSEEKATKIFDVLSFILDENALIQKDAKDMGSFIEKQINLLSALSVKFPNVEVIAENLAIAKEVSQSSSTVLSKLDEENNQIFTAMDLMQFHDINRQKIERVMSVIKKLTTYLNGIFEDDSGKPEVQIAKHISGDGTDTVSNDDLDSLIAEFSN